MRCSTPVVRCATRLGDEPRARDLTSGRSRVVGMTARITAFFLGGTIAMAGHQDGVVSRLDAGQLVGSVPALAELDVDLDVRDFRRVPSASLSFQDVAELTTAAEACACDGIV